MTAIAAHLFVRSHRQSPTILTKEAIVVVDEKAWRVVPVCPLTDPMFHSGEHRGSGDIDMYNAPRIDLHNDEIIGHHEEGRVLGECWMPSLAANSSAILSSPHSGWSPEIRLM